MSLFRSEEHARRWTAAHHHALGAVVPLAQVWRLAKAWYGDPRRGDWRPRTHDEAQRVLSSVDLTGPFWQLAP